MALEALSSTELLNFIIYDTLSSTPFSYNDYSNNVETSFNTRQQLSNGCGGGGGGAATDSDSFLMPMAKNSTSLELENTPKNKQQVSLGVVQGRKKRRRRPKVCKNKEEAETQRMTHIAVERNRRKQMNEHLAVLRSLMPQSYVQRGDQASIVGGAINYVKELEQMLQSLETKKFLSPPQQRAETIDTTTTTTKIAATATTTTASLTPFTQFFTYPQYTTCSQFPSDFTSTSKVGAIADIEVTLIETHANVRILCRRRVRQLSKMISGFQTLYLSVLHLNVTTLDPLILYSISAKVEEGCQFKSADDIATAIHHILGIIEEEPI